MNSRAVNYVKLRIKGVGIIKAAQVSRVLLPSGGSVTIFMAIALLFVNLHRIEAGADASLKDAEATLKYHQTKILASESIAASKKLENVVIRCLNGDVVLIDNHTHQCTIKKY